MKQMEIYSELPFSIESVLYVRFSLGPKDETVAWVENTNGYSICITYELAWEIIEQMDFVTNHANRNTWTKEEHKNIDYVLLYLHHKLGDKK